MSSAHGSEGHGGGHGGGGEGSNAMWECLFGYCPEVKGAAHQLTGMCSFLVNWIFSDGWGGGGHGDHGHH